MSDASASTQIGSRLFVCQDCGRMVGAREFHDYIECIRWRWSNHIVRDGSEGADRRYLHQAEEDIASLIAYITSKEDGRPAMPK